VWILNFVPDFVFHALLILSLLALAGSFVLDSIPFISANAKAIQLASAVVLAIAIFFEGAISNESVWQARVKELELKIARAETQSAEANSELRNKMAEKNKEIALAQQALKGRIEQNAAQMDAVCKIPRTAIDILNDAARKTGDKK
jgi:hypothetical protein